MSYKVDNRPIADYGAVPIARSGYLALTGIFDLPKRKGATEHNWGTEIEPHLNDEDIEIDGRTLTLSVRIRDNNLASLQHKINRFTKACVECRSIATAFATFNVYCTGQVEVQEFGSFATVTARFWQQDVDFKSLTIKPTSLISGYEIDGFNLTHDFGIHVANRQSFESIAKRIDIPTTEFYRKTAYREQTVVKMNCSMIGNNAADLYNKMCQFHTLIYRNNARVLQWQKEGYEGVKNVAKVYCKSGFSVQIPAQTMLRFSIPFVLESISTTLFRADSI